jgi:hypothetical protein
LLWVNKRFQKTWHKKNENFVLGASLKVTSDNPMKIALAFAALFLANSAFAGCDLVEDPPISETNCNDYALSMASSSPWTMVLANPSNFGLLSNGSISVSATLSASDGSTVVGQILPTQAGLVSGKVNAKAATVNDSVELVLAKTGSTQTMQLRVLRAGVLESTHSANLPSGTSTSFDLSYGFVNGQMNVQVHSAASQLLNVSVSDFGLTLPRLMLRRGADVTNGVSTAAFVQTSYSGQ